tara:strand:- start:535 stop:855 length:321 start_codon:yes stop_codon:yes gene_type:complete
MAAAKKKLENPLVGFDAANPKLPGPKVQAVPKPTVKATVTRHHFDGNIIKVIGEKAPVREGSRRAEIFALFKDDMPLNEFLSAARKIRGGAPDVQIALDKKFIELV